MRLAACAFAGVLLSGCSWLGHGGYGHNSGYNAYSAYGVNCAQPAYMATQVAYMAYDGCLPGMGYDVAPGGSHAHGGHYAMAGGAVGYEVAGVGAMGATTLGMAAPYGASVAVDPVSGAGLMATQGVATVQGAPVYGTYSNAAAFAHGTPALRGSMHGGYGMYGGMGACGYGGAYGYGGGGCGNMPYGIEASVGTELEIGGDIFPGEASKPFLGGPGTVSDLDPVSYSDAFNTPVSFELATTYDLNDRTTIIGQVGYIKADGQRIQIGTVDDGGGTTEDLFGEFDDLEQLRLEGGVRRYMGGFGMPGSGLRPYVGAMGGFTKTDDVTLVQSSATLVDPALFTQTYIDGGWSPTVAGIVGAEWAVGPKGSIGVETGIRWSDNLDTNFASDDRWTIPLKLRGRVSF